MKHKIIKKSKITFVGNESTIGDGENPDTMDYFLNQKSPWLSLIVPKLQQMDYQVEVVNWKDESIDWNKKEYVILGPIWGYSTESKKFSSWLDHIQQCKTILMINSAEFIKWNYQKTYLNDLTKFKIPTPKSLIISSDSDINLYDIIRYAKKNWLTDDIIIKGVIDAAAFGYKHIKKTDDVEETLKHIK